MDLQEEFNKLDLPKSLAVGLGIAGLYWALIFDSGRNLEAQIARATQEITQSKASIERVRKALEDKVKFQDEIDEINLNMRDFQKYFTPDMDANKLLSRVSAFAEKHQISVNNLKPIEKPSEFPGFAETAVEMKIEGPFHNIMEFISSLSKMEKAIDFSQMKFKTTVKGDYPKVELTTTLVVYSSNETLGGGEKTGG